MPVGHTAAVASALAVGAVQPIQAHIHSPACRRGHCSQLGSIVQQGPAKHPVSATLQQLDQGEGRWGGDGDERCQCLRVISMPAVPKLPAAIRVYSLSLPAVTCQSRIGSCCQALPTADSREPDLNHPERPGLAWAWIPKGARAPRQAQVWARAAAPRQGLQHKLAAGPCVLCQDTDQGTGKF